MAFSDWQDPVSSLWIMRTDGSDQRELIDHSVSDSMQWSPDGTAILIEDQPANGHDSSIWSIHPDGSGKTLLLAAPTAANARAGMSWQPQP